MERQNRSLVFTRKEKVMKLVCVKCGKELRCKKNEIIVEELVLSKSCRIWEADLWKCPGCRTEIIAGFGLEPIAEHFQEDYQKILAREKKRVEVYQLES